jgi:hypothetical protein
LIKDIPLMLSSTSLSHNIIPLLAIGGSASHHLFGLTRRTRLHSMTTLKSYILDVIFFSCNKS